MVELSAQIEALLLSLESGFVHPITGQESQLVIPTEKEIRILNQQPDDLLERAREARYYLQRVLNELQEKDSLQN